MTVTMSSKGQIVVPKELRDRAGIESGDQLEISLDNGVVKLRKAGGPVRRSLKIRINKKTGFPYFDVPSDAASITDDWVKQQLTDFP